MCSPKDGFKLCSCGKSVKKRTFLNKILYPKRAFKRDTPYLVENTWKLYSKYNHDDLDGDIMLPEETQSIAKKLLQDFGHFADTLNAKNCFDFEYTPAEEDELYLSIDGKELKFIYDKKWWLDVPNSSGLSSWDYWLLNDGKVKKDK